VKYLEPWRLLRLAVQERKTKPIGHVRYINILTWLQGFQDKLLYSVLFSFHPSPFWEARDKRKLKNFQFLPERGLLRITFHTQMKKLNRAYAHTCLTAMQVY